MADAIPTGTPQLKKKVDPSVAPKEVSSDALPVDSGKVDYSKPVEIAPNHYRQDF